MTTIHKMTLRTVLTCGILVLGCTPDSVDSTCDDTTTTGVSTSTTSSATTTGPNVCGECDDYTDCPTSKNECRVWVCVMGRCVEEDVAPDHGCADNDAPCWRGACCFTCIADLGATLGKMDPYDGPCMSGTDDHLCGFGGGLCEDCALTEQVCIAGHCVKQ